MTPKTGREAKRETRRGKTKEKGNENKGERGVKEAIN